MNRANLRKLLNLLILFTLFSTTAAAAPAVEFVNTGIADGAETRAALRDRYGFLWVGTSTGLNCYDGNGNAVYDNLSQVLLPTTGMLTNTLCESGDSILIGGNTGLYIFNRKDNSITAFRRRTRYGVLVSAAVEKILETGDKRVWICTQGQGIFLYNRGDSTLLQNSRHGSYYSDLALGSNGLVYAASLNGEIQSFGINGSMKQSFSLPDYTIDKNSIQLAASGRDIWIASGSKLYRLNTTSNVVEAVPLDANISTVNALIPRLDGTLMLGTNNGLWSYNTLNGKLLRIKRPSDGADSYSDDKITNLRAEANGDVIILRQDGPVEILSDLTPVAEFKPIAESGHRNSATLRAVVAAADGKSFWAGSDRGLSHISLSDDEFHITPIPAFDGYSVTALALDGKQLWIGTADKGLIVYNTADGSSKKYTYSENTPYSILANEINDVYHSADGQIYILTNWGISRYDRKSDYFLPLTEFSQHTHGTAMTDDAEGGQWIATANNGLYHRRHSGERFDRTDRTTIGSLPVTDLHVDGVGRLWAATRNHGLFLFDPSANDFRQVAIPLSDNKPINFMADDAAGRLWVGVNNMLACVSDGKDVAVYRFPHHADLVPAISSDAIDASGAIIIGSRGGFSVFDPTKVKPYEGLVKVLPKSISFPGPEGSEGSNAYPGLNSLLYTRDEIELPFDHNSFTIHLAAIHPATEPDIRFDYKLEGIDKNWTSASAVPDITYNNLAPGKYTLLMKPHGFPDAEVSRLNITILAPWYLSGWAIAAYIVAAVLLFFLAFLLGRRIMKRKFNRRLTDIRMQKERELFQAKTRYFVDLVHEIRTPLMLISLPLEQLAERMRSEADDALRSNNQKYIGSMQRNIDYLLGITNQLLDFRKAENNSEIQLNRSNCDLGRMLTDICSRFDDPMTIGGKHISLEINTDDVMATVDADKTERLLMNLVGNGMKYARSKVGVTLSRTADGQLSVSVGDDGPGVPADERDKIFDTFYQIGNDNVAASLGTGLGLAYAKLIADAHGGSISVGDSPYGGAQFTILLPQGEAVAEQADEMTAASYEETDTREGSTAQRSRATILLAEDNRDLREMISEALGRHFTVITADDGAEAFERLADSDIDVIVSDVMMPRLSGLELCAKVKGDINYSHIPFIILTAKTGREAQEEGLQCGADVYLEKPFPVRQLVYQINNLLRTRNLFYERMRSVAGFEPGGRTPAESAEVPAMNSRDLKFLEKMNSIITESISDEEFSIDLLAEQLNMSRSSFYRKITATTGMTPSDYLKTFRLNHGARLLLDGCRVSEVAARVGFTSSSYFAKCFRGKFGMLPSEYISQAQSGEPISGSDS